MGNVIPPVFEKIPSVGIIETSDRFLQSDRGLVARALTKGNTITPVRVMNISTEPLTCTLYQGTFVAILSNIEDAYDETTYSRKDRAKLPDHLKAEDYS